mmetsp:Transcript_39974/g.113321  ORF Transcript_39974/g.113321 Transcript_39974/m.113321 type:complete len:215 (+) Transcript_39974:1126-1770(+)
MRLQGPGAWHRRHHGQDHLQRPWPQAAHLLSVRPILCQGGHGEAPLQPGRRLQGSQAVRQGAGPHGGRVCACQLHQRRCGGGDLRGPEECSGHRRGHCGGHGSRPQRPGSSDRTGLCRDTVVGGEHGCLSHHHIRPLWAGGHHADLLWGPVAEPLRGSPPGAGGVAGRHSGLVLSGGGGRGNGRGGGHCGPAVPGAAASPHGGGSGSGERAGPP